MASGRLPAVWGLALLATRWFVPAESAHLGETLWIVQLWLLTACAWSLFVLLRRTPPPRLDRADAAVWLLVAGHVLSALLVLSTEGQKRFALNMLWEWIGVGISTTLLRQWLPGATGLQLFARTLAVGAVVLGGFGLWQYGFEFPRYRDQLQELIRLEDRLSQPDSSLSTGELSRFRELEQQLGTLATELDPVTRFKLRQRLLDSTEPLGRFALTNTLAGLLAAGLILLLGRISTAGQWAFARWRMLLTLLTAGLVAYCLVLTKSRTAWAGLIVGVIGWGLLSRGWQIPLRRVVSGVAIAFLAVAALVLVAVWSGGLDRLVLTEAPKSLGYRWEYWTASVRVLVDHPLFGTGPGNFRQHYLQHKLPGSSEEVLDPHNQFLDVWACGGLLAVVGLVWIWLRFLHRSRGVDAGAPAQGPRDAAEAARTGSSGWGLPAVGLVALMLLVIVQFLFETFWDVQAIALLAGWLVASFILKDVEVPRSAILAAGLALGVHLLGAGGIAMPAVCVPLMLLLLGTVGERERRRTGPPERFVVNNAPQRPFLRVASSLALLVLAGACLLTGLWPSYYARLLSAAGEFAVYSRRDSAAARREFEAATRADELDPDPWFHLANLEYGVVSGNTAADDEAFGRAMRHLQEAIRRDPMSPKLEWAAGQWQFARFESTGDARMLTQALQSMERARQGYPHHAGIRGTFAEVLAAAGRPDANEEARVALRLDDINQERGHIDLWLAPEVRTRLQAIADRGLEAVGSDAETLP